MLRDRSQVPSIQLQAGANTLEMFKVGFDGTCIDAIASRLDRNEKVAFELLELAQIRLPARSVGDVFPPIVEPLVRRDRWSSGTSPSHGFSTFVRDGDDVYQAHSTTWRGLEFVMTYYPILDHSPKGRDEGETWQLWIRRHDEYEAG